MSQPRPSFEPEQVYHIWTHANGSENLFRVGENYRYFLKKYAFYIYPVVDTYAYCLMPNHLHLMVRIKSEEEVLAALRKGRATLQGFETLEGFPKPSACSFHICLMPIHRPITKFIKEKAVFLYPTLIGN